MERVNVLGVMFDNLTMKEAVEKCDGFLVSEKMNMIVTPNPEIVMCARKEKSFMNLLNDSELTVPDGIGIIIASKILRKPLKERVPGFDLICNFLEDTSKNLEKKVFLFGAKPGVADIAKEKLEQKYKIEVVGTHDGYFKPEEEESIVEQINNSGANILLVGLGMKKQEEFIEKYKERLNVKIAIGCGGTIDVFAGTAKRAPKIFRKLGLEWLYRLIKQPSRIGRMMQLPKFLLIVLFRGNKESINI